MVEFARWLAERPFLDAAFWLSSAYAELIGYAVRKDRALIFTPPDLADCILKQLMKCGANFATAKIIDPACGGAAFIVPVVLAIKAQMSTLGRSPRQILRHIETHVVGCDIDATLCKLSRCFVCMALYEEIAACGYQPRVAVQCKNARRMLQDCPRLFDIVLCNPPYRKISAEELPRLSATEKEFVNGQPNLYSLFMVLAMKFSRTGGYIALLTPTGFLSGRSFTKLRAYLVTRAATRAVCLIDKRIGVFVGVEQETAVTVFQRGQSGDSHANNTSVYAIGSASPPEHVGDVSLPRTGSPWILPRSPSDMALVQLFLKVGHNLQTYGYKPRVGAYVVHRDKRPLASARKHSRTIFPLIWCSDIGRNGSFTFRRAGKSRYVEMGSNKSSAILNTAAVALHRTSAKDESRRPVAAPISEEFVRKHLGYVGENHVVFLLPLVNKAPALSVDVLSSILGSFLLDRLFRCISGTVAVSASELALLPLPDPQIMVAALNRGVSVEKAVAEGFGLDPVATSGGNKPNDTQNVQAIAN